MSDKKPLIIIAGPTAVGKTKLGVELALHLGGEIISADSMQVYKYMDIGTAKVTKSEMKGVKHHLIDVYEPTMPYHVVEFKNMAQKALESIYEASKIPIVVGGTGFYIQALLYDIDFSESGEDENLRKELNDIANNKGADALFDILKEIDPETALTLHPNNVKRVIRAIEFARQTGEKISDHNSTQRAKKSPYDFHYFVLNDDRAAIYKRIDERVDNMIKDGLVDELKRLLEMGCTKDMTSMQGIGYKQLIPYINNEYDLEEAIRLIKRDSRHFAKRQLTWFNRENDLEWIDIRKLPTTDAQIEYITQIIN